MDTEVSAREAKGSRRRFARDAPPPTPSDRGSVLEAVPADQWQVEPSTGGESHVLRDYDGATLVRLGTSALAEKQRLAGRVPVSLATRGPDAFWLYRGTTLRCDRGLAWWDVEALIEAGTVNAQVAASTRAGNDNTSRPASAPSGPGRTARKAITHMREHGVAATLDKVEERLRPHVFLKEAHVWSELRISSDLEAKPLPAGLELLRGSHADLDDVVRIPGSVARAEAERRLEQGAQLWLVRDGKDVAFVCWIFLDAGLSIASPGGRYRLPAGTAMLDDTLAAETHRGRGIAPAAWTQIALQLLDLGFNRMVTKVEVDNAPSRRAVEKGGFVEGAVLHLRRIGTRNQIRVETLASTQLAQELQVRTG